MILLMAFENKFSPFKVIIFLSIFYFFSLRRYEETNEMLRQFLELSDATYKMLLDNYTGHTKTLNILKKDLESSFKRIRCVSLDLLQ